jgi:hypothetical protein
MSDNQLDPESDRLVTKLAELFMRAVSSAAGRPMKVIVGFAPTGGGDPKTKLTLMSNMDPEAVKQIFADLGQDLDVEAAKASREAYRLSGAFEQAGVRAN